MGPVPSGDEVGRISPNFTAAFIYVIATEMKAGEVPLAARQIGPANVCDLMIFFDADILT